jgi:hypothetical protein
VGFTALIEDLSQRGLLAETLVVAIGEFGRTPKINGNAGRDHWGHVFSFAMAGAGISGGQVYGSSDNIGAYPRTGKMEPQDFIATIFHLLGIGHEAFFPDATGRPLHVTEGQPIAPILGTGPATDRRVAPGGNIAFVPPYSDAPLLNMAFEDSVPLARAGSRQHLKGWQAAPLYDSAQAVSFGVALVTGPDRFSSKTRPHVRIGYGLKDGKANGMIRPSARAILTQEVRAPRAGRYTLTVHARGGAASAEHYRDVFLKHFSCRLVIFGYSDAKKDVTRVRQFASSAFQPTYRPAADRKTDEAFTLTTILKSQDDGAFHLSKGVGVAVVVETTTTGETDLAGLGDQAHGFIEIDRLGLEFIPRPRNDDVQV